MLVVNSAMYKDVTISDFNHYFASTAMAWKLSPTKRRLYLVSGMQGGGNITGSYLTREKEFKDKALPFKNWWEHLDVIAIQPLMFNLPTGAAIWQHKFSKNTRKSFPWTTNAILYYGNVSPEHRTLQCISSIAFQELYGTTPDLPTLRQALKNKGVTTVTQEKFVVNWEGNNLNYRALRVGSFNPSDGSIKIPKNKAGILLRLYSAGIPRDQIEIVESPPEKAISSPPPWMKHNLNWVTGYDKGKFEVGYCVKLAVPGSIEVRTYSGVFPGQQHLIAGWMLYDYWGPQE